MKRLPVPPKSSHPDLSLILAKMRSDPVQQYIADANSEYRHWEKLKHIQPPEGLTPEQAWCLVKWSRISQKQSLSFTSAGGRHFSYWLPTTAQEILHEVDRWGGTAMLAIPEGLDKDMRAMRNRVIVSSLMEEAIATSQIEGAVTTRKVAKEMLRTQRKPRDRSEQMIVNSYRTMRLIREKASQPLSLELLFEIEEHMTRDTLDDLTAVGRFRTPQENIQIIDSRDEEIVFVPPPAEQLPQRVVNLIEFANAPSEKGSFVHPLIKAAILHFWLAYEHPFVDGNGRTARSLFYWFMLKSGYWLFEFLTVSRVIVASPAQYYRAFLYTEQDENDLTYSIIYMLKATQKALANLREYLAEKQAEQQRVAASLRRFPTINPRQRALLTHALEDPTEIYTFQSHQASHNITYVTARTDLLGLRKLGLLAEVNQGKRRGFIAVEDLAEKLGSTDTAAHKKRKK